MTIPKDEQALWYEMTNELHNLRTAVHGEIALDRRPSLEDAFGAIKRADVLLTRIAIRKEGRP